MHPTHASNSRCNHHRHRKSCLRSSTQSRKIIDSSLIIHGPPLRVAMSVDDADESNRVSASNK